MEFSLQVLFKHGWRSTRDLIVPPSCISCNESVANDRGLCPKCWEGFQWISEPMCPIMGVPFSHDLGEGTLSAEAIVQSLSFDRARCVVLYNKAARKMVSRLKYGDDLALTPWIAKQMARAANQMQPSQKWDFVVPVPLHKKRLLTRRYNQAAELSRHIAHSVDTPYDPLSLLRVRSTHSQVGLKKDARKKNVAGAFAVPTDKRANIHGSAILLVDDVYTTGATIEACSRALRRAGAAHIDVVTFARVSTSELELEL